MDAELTEERALLVRAPTTLLLGGEGSLPPTLQHGRYHTLTVALDCHVHLLLSSDPGTEVKIVTGAGELAEETDEGSGWQRIIDALRVVIRYFGIEGGLRAEVMVEAPPHAGIGTQAAALVAAVKGLALWSGLNLHPPEVAAIASEVARPLGEAGLLTAYLYASAFGGIQRLRRDLGREGRPTTVEVEAVDDLIPERLERAGLLFLPPRALHRQTIAPLWRNPATAEVRRRRNEGRLSAIEAAWRAGETEQLARLLDAVSGLEEASFVDPPIFGRAYRLAKQAGAWGGFLAQDGVGSSLLILAAPERQAALRGALEALGLRGRPLHLDRRRFAALAVEPWRRRRIARRGVAPINRYG